ncbi:uncharacterized protein [Nicotiana tomentosiformis]|uniref:uncharacterized protein n=1 Tax=Nicotiana tomentosiformis TaxID=4098 RepID=UPI00388C8575
MTGAMILQNFYRGINTTNQCVVNQLAGGNFMTTLYAEACKILDEIVDTSSAWQSRANVPQGDPNMIHLHKELHDHGQAIAELTTTMNQLAKSQLQQVKGPKQVNAMEGVNMMEEVQYVNNFQGQRNNSQGPNQQQWRSQVNQGNWNSNNQGNWSCGNNQGNWSCGNNQGGDATTSSQRKIVDDEQVIQEDEIPNNLVQASDEVRIDIDDNVEETQEEVNPYREHIVDIPKPVVPKAKAPMPRPPPPYRQRLAKQNVENQFKNFIDMMKILFINVPLVEALEKMPGYAKFMKDLVTNKRSMNWRPFLAMGKALVDVEVGELTFRVGDEKVVFYVCKSMRQPNSNEVYSFVALVTDVIIDDTSAMMNVDDTLEVVLLNLDDDEKDGYVECRLHIGSATKEEESYRMYIGGYSVYKTRLLHAQDYFERGCQTLR